MARRHAPDDPRQLFLALSYAVPRRPRPGIASRVLSVLPARLDYVATYYDLPAASVCGALGSLAGRGLARRVEGEGVHGLWERAA